MRRHTKVRPSVRKPAPQICATIERLEDRRLLSDVTFNTPVTSPLPSGFQCQKLISATGNRADNYRQNLIATSSAGGGLWLESDATGSYTVKAQLNTTATILGFAEVFVSVTSQGQTEDIGETGVFTTAGIMLQPSDGTFAAPNGLNYPSDAVQGAFAIGDFDSTDHLQNPDLAVERFTPNANTPGRGTLTIAVFPIRTDGTLGAEIDTTLTTDGVPDAGNEPLAAADFSQGGNLDIVADGKVWLGKGDGTFDAANPVALPVSTSVGSYVAADFNSDNRTDIAFLPTSGPSSGTAQVLLNNPDGTFHAGGSAIFGGAGTTNGVLIAADFTMDQTTDLASDIVSGSQVPAVSIAPNIGQATFFSPDLVSTPGFEPQVSADFNVDSEPDLVGISSIGGQFSVVSVENKTAVGSVVRLSASPNPSVAGQPVTLLATVTNPASIYSQSLILVDGSTQLGDAPLNNGTAVFVTSKLSAGTHSLTAGQSNPVIETVNAAPIDSPLLTATGLSRKSHDWLVPGAKDTLRLDLANLGGASASTTLGVKLFATIQGTIDSNAIPIPIPSLELHAVHVRAKGQATLTGNYTLPEDIPAGTYYLAAQVTPVDGLLGSQLLNGTVVDTDTVTVAWEFGDVNGRKNVAMTQHLSNGQVVTFKLTGSGTGFIGKGGGAVSLGSGNPNFQVTVENSSSHDTLSISQTGGTASNIVSLTIASDLGTCDVKSDTPHAIDSAVNFTTLTRLFLGDIPTALSGGSQAPGGITIDDHVGALSAGALNGANVTIGSIGDKKSISMKIATMDAGSQVVISSPRSSLDVESAAAGSVISAPDIDKLNSQGDFDATLNVTGTTKGARVLGQVNIGGSVIGTSTSPVRWAVNGNTGKIHVGGDIKDLELLAGAQLGSAGELASPPATYSGTDIQSFEVGGSVSSSLISAGLDPVDGVLLNSNDTLLSGGAIGSISVKGLASNDSRFLASDLPTNAKTDSATVITAQDPRFALT